MKRGRDLRASTLAETLVVMILAGIVLLSVFDGLDLFGKMLRRVQGRIERTMEHGEGFYRLRTLFAGCDSIRGGAERMALYRQGVVSEEIVIGDSLLIVRRPAAETAPDTLFDKVSDPRIVRNPENPERIDSLYVRLDTTLLRLGVALRPEREAEERVGHIEKNNDGRADR